MAASGVTRLAELYARVEQLRALELAIAAGAVQEVLRVEDQEREQRVAQCAAARVALINSDRREWLVVEQELELQRNRLGLLASWRQQREQLREQALSSHRASRMEREQMMRVAEERRKAQLVEADRRDQATSDDRYLSRLLWRGQAALDETGAGE